MRLLVTFSLRMGFSLKSVAVSLWFRLKLKLRKCCFLVQNIGVLVHVVSVLEINLDKALIVLKIGSHTQKTNLRFFMFLSICWKVLRTYKTYGRTSRSSRKSQVHLMWWRNLCLSCYESDDVSYIIFWSPRYWNIIDSFWKLLLYDDWCSMCTKKRVWIILFRPLCKLLIAQECMSFQNFWTGSTRHNICFEEKWAFSIRSFFVLLSD